MGYIAAYVISGVLSDYVFEPFMRGNSFASIVIGKVIGNGDGRGIALLLVIAGVGLAGVGIVVVGLRSVKTLEGEKEENETITEGCLQRP
jgi:hypothetical protein